MPGWDGRPRSWLEQRRARQHMYEAVWEPVSTHAAPSVGKTLILGTGEMALASSTASAKKAILASGQLIVAYGAGEQQGSLQSLVTAISLLQAAGACSFRKV